MHRVQPRIVALIALAMLAPLALTAVAQQAPDWLAPLRWPDGKEIQWRASKAPGCDGSNVEVRLFNNSPSSGMAKMSQPKFACVRSGEYVGGDRDIGMVAPGQTASMPGFNCACAEKGGVSELLSANLEFTRNGAGTDVIGNGCTYAGDYVNGERNGKGVYDCPNYHYEGAFRANKRNGYGVEKLPGGETYEGQFVDDQHQGMGKMTYADGSTYDGDFRANLREGVGTAKFKDGAHYMGEWKGDHRVGHGTYTAADESWTYDGDWSGDLRNGDGKLTYTDGSYTYQGPFRNDLREGDGVATFSDGRTFHGTFVANEQAGKGELTFANGRKITGDFKDQMPSGQAIEVGPAATIDGQWLKGALEGKAVVTYPTGERFEGVYAGGKRNGVGTDVRKDGSKEECTWVNDVRQQPCTQITRDGKRIEFRSPGGKAKTKN